MSVRQINKQKEFFGSIEPSIFISDRSIEEGS